MKVNGKMGRAGRVWVAVAMMAAGLVFVGGDTARAAGTFVHVPTRLYMIPKEHSMVVPDLLAGLFIPIETMKFVDVPVGDVISAQSREIKVTAAEQASCNVVATSSPPFSITGCTAIQLDVGNGTLKFDPAPVAEDDPRYPMSVPRIQMYRFSSGVLLRDADEPADLESSDLALLGTSAAMDAVLKTLVYTPTVDDPATLNSDEDYYYDGSDPEQLQIDLVPGDSSGTVTRYVDIRVLDYNNFPDVDVPQYDWAADPGMEVEMFMPNANTSNPPDVPTLEVSDEDNDEVIDEAQDGDDDDTDPGDGDDPDDGAGDEFLVIAWSSCGKFSMWSQNGWAVTDDLADVVDYAFDQASDPSADQSERQTFEDALFAILPNEVKNFPFATSNPTNFSSVFAGVSDDIGQLNYALGRMTFKAVDDMDNPLQDTTCQVRVLISDLGNNGLPLHYLGDPPSGVEIPMFGVDLLGTNDAPGVEKFTIQVGAGTTIDASLPPLALSVPEGDLINVPITIANDPALPAEHPAFDLTLTVGGTAPSTDYDPIPLTITVPADATSVPIPIQTIDNAVPDGDRTINLTLTPPATPPPGYTVTDTTPSVVVTILDDEVPPPEASIGDLTLAEGNSGTTSFSFPVTLSAPAPVAATVLATASNGSAITADSDYVAASQTVSFAPGDSSKVFTVMVNGDTKFEPDETFNVTLTMPSGMTILDPTAVGTITNDDTQPAVSINDLSVAEGNAGTTLANFDVTLSNPSDSDVTVMATTADDTATTADPDYMANSEMLTFSPGEISKPFAVTVNGDTKFEPNETFAVNLTSPTGASVLDAQGVGTITNDDSQPTISVTDVTKLEGNSGTTAFDFTIQLSNASASTVTVDAATSDDSALVADNDYPSTTGMVTFVPGVTTQTFTVLVNGDTDPESNETFNVNLTNPTEATISDGLGVGTITNDDVGAGTPGVSIGDVTMTEGTASDTTFTFTLTLTEASGVDAEVDVTTLDGTATTGDNDYVSNTQTVMFAAGQISKSFAVTVKGDPKYEGDETFTATLSNPTGGIVITDDSGLGTITNDDALPTLSINDVAHMEGDSGTTAYDFTVTLSAASGVATTVDVATADNSATIADGDYATASGTLTFAPGDTTKTFTVDGNGDTTYEPNEVFHVNLTNSLGATVLDDQGVGTITNDDDKPMVSVDDVTHDEGNSGTTPFDFTVGLSNASTETVTVDIATADDSATTADPDYGAASATLTFAPGETSQTFTVDVTGDTKFELDETFEVNLSNPGNATLMQGQDQGDGTITNDDAPPTISIDDVEHPEGDSGTTTFAYTVSLSNASYLAVGATVDVSDDTATVADMDYVDNTQSLTFAPGDLTKTFTVMVNGDTTVEADEIFNVGLSGITNAGAGKTTGVGTVTNDDIAPGTSGVTIDDVAVAEGDSGVTNATFTLTLSSAAPTDTSVTATTADDTAMVGDNDYAANSQVVTIPAGMTTGSFVVGVNGDTTVEVDETFTVTLSNPIGLTITDGEGVGTISNDDSIVKSIALAIQVPANIVRDADPNQSGAAVAFPAPTSTGGTGAVTITCSHQSGAFYPLGVTTVTCTAVDSAPDLPRVPSFAADAVRIAAALSVSASFTITVNPVGQTPPTTIPGSIIPGGTAPPGSTVGAVPPGPEIPPTGQLPETGSSISELLVAALVALVVGGVLLLARRRPAPR